MTPLQILLLALAIWVAFATLIRWVVIPALSRGPDGTPVTYLLWLAARNYSRLVHRVKATGQEAFRKQNDVGPLIVVANHTGVVDPLLIQGECGFHIRWMMAADMMGPGLDWLWRREKMIAVARNGQDSGPLREAIRHVKRGGVLGVFPEGRIVIPHGQVWPFFTGVGFIVAKTKAPVMISWIAGTPETNDLGKGLTTPSRATVVFDELHHFEDEGDPAAIAEALRKRLAEISGWRIEDNPPERVVVAERDLFAPA